MIRVAYALLLYCIMYFVLQTEVEAVIQGGITGIGAGGPIFRQTVRWHCLGIYLFLPLMTCSTIVDERERQTLDVLLTTQLSPWHIALEKLFSRLIPMTILLVISFPVLAIAYSLGGVSRGDLGSAAVVLVMIAMQIGCIGVACSSYYLTVPRALIGTYFWSFLSFVCPTQICAASLLQVGAINLVLLVLSILYTAVFCWYLLKRSAEWIARPPKFQESKREIVYGATGYKFAGSLLKALPEDQPVLWREKVRRWSAGLDNLTMKMALWVFQTFLMIHCLAIASSDNRVGQLHFWAVLFSVGAIPMICSKTITAVTYERLRQTIDVLAVTPISSQEILNGKLYEPRKTIQLFSIPLVTILACELIWRDLRLSEQIDYVLAAVTYTCVLPRLFMWISVLVTVYVRNQATSIVVSVLVCAMVVLYDEILLGGRPSAGSARVSPIQLFETLFLTVGHFRTGRESVLLNVIAHGALWLVVSQIALRDASMFFERLESKWRNRSTKRQ